MTLTDRSRIGIRPTVSLDTIETNPLIISVEYKDVYGRQLIYPVCAKAKTLCALLGSKTLPESSLEHIKALGFTLHVKSPDSKI